MVLVKDREDQLDRSCEKLRNMTKTEGKGSTLYTVNRRKGNWIGHILRSNCLLIHVIGGKMGGKDTVKGRRGRRRKQLLDDLKEKRGYWKFTDEVLYLTLLRTLMHIF